MEFLTNLERYLTIKKEGLIPPILDRLSILEMLFWLK